MGEGREDGDPASVPARKTRFKFDEFKEPSATNGWTREKFIEWIVEEEQKREPARFNATTAKDVLKFPLDHSVSDGQPVP